jgi:hypothetical protein
METVMMKRSAALVLALTLAGGAATAAPPASKDACLDQSFVLAEKVAAAKMPADAQKKAEGLLTDLEAKCSAEDMAGAEADIKAIEAAIAGK